MLQVFPANLSGSEHEGGEGESSRWIKFSKLCNSYVLVVSLCLNLLPFVVCLLQTLPLLCKSTSLRAFEGKRVLSGLACKYTNSHLNNMLQVWICIFSSVCTNTEIQTALYSDLQTPTWTTCSSDRYSDLQIFHLNDEVPEFLEVAIALPGVVVNMQLLGTNMSNILCPGQIFQTNKYVNAQLPGTNIFQHLQHLGIKKPRKV